MEVSYSALFLTTQSEEGEGGEEKSTLTHDSLQYLMAKFKAEYLAPEECYLSIILGVKERK